MKKLLASLVLVAAVAGLANADEMFGNAVPKNTDVTKYNKLMTVYNSDAVAHENGDVVVWQYDATYGVEIASTTSADSKAVAGIVYPNTIAANAWGTIMVYGYHSAIAIGVANSAGDCLGTSTTAEVTGVTTTAGACIATALEATTSSTTVKGLVRGL